MLGESTPKLSGYEQRIIVPQELRPWGIDYPEYYPPHYNNEEFLTEGQSKGWADDPDPRKVNFALRPSYEGPFDIDPATGAPLNPRGRQGLAGRGELGKWGVNKAADPVLIAVDAKGCRKILLIQRASDDWGFAGGMVDSGENERRMLHCENCEKRRALSSWTLTR